jgi:hypothetical protein
MEMAAKALEISGARANVGQMVTASELTADHVKALPGTPLDPTAMVDAVTLAPVDAPAP